MNMKCENVMAIIECLTLWPTRLSSSTGSYRIVQSLLPFERSIRTALWSRLLSKDFARQLPPCRNYVTSEAPAKRPSIGDTIAMTFLLDSLMPPLSIKKAPPTSASYRVKNSPVHGRGVFATRKIAANTQLIEYTGDRITFLQACKNEAARDDQSTHTFLFSLEDGRVIDGGKNGNDARWINHSCEPNCQAEEKKGRIFISALHNIARGEELNYDYGLVLEERHTPSLKRAYLCLCGAEDCRQTLLAPKPRRKKTVVD